MTDADFALFEVIVKPGCEPAFDRRDLLVASSRLTGRDGHKIYFCATVQAGAFRTYLSISDEVESYQEI